MPSTVKEDFLSLFKKDIEEIRSLPQRFSLRDFNFMVTSQRTMGRIFDKMDGIDKNLTTRKEHGNFWPDLRLMGLAEEDKETLSEFGRVALAYFRTEQDDFKREHFLLSSIRRGEYDIPRAVRDLYFSKVANFQDYMKRVPGGRGVLQEIIRNEEKLFFTECLNTFPNALDRYFALPSDRQARLDTLHESGLKDLINQLDTSEAEYAKVARRFLNVWRALNRRTNFVRSVILSEYEDGLSSDLRAEMPLDKPGPYEGLMSQNDSIGLIEKSDRVSIDQGKGVVIRGRRRSRRARIITDPESLTKREWLEDAESKLVDSTNLAERELARRALVERRTRGHQELVRKVVKRFYTHPLVEPKEDPFSFDLLVERAGSALLHEMKTVKDGDPADERSQVIRAIGQLLYYEFFDVPRELSEESSRITKIAVLERRPSDDHIAFLKMNRIESLWFENGDVHGDGLNLIHDFIKNAGIDDS